MNRLELIQLLEKEKDLRWFFAGFIGDQVIANVHDVKPREIAYAVRIALEAAAEREGLKDVKIRVMVEMDGVSVEL